jgi:CopG family nickel-responsive transcriptional regulator
VPTRLASVIVKSGTTIMHRITITIDDELMSDLDRVMKTMGYQSRSEAIRDFARAGIAQAREAHGDPGECVAALVYVYKHSERELGKRLTQSFHDHHDLSLGTLHLHLDADTCMEITALRGTGAMVRHVAEHVIAERGVRHGRIVSVPLPGPPARTSVSVQLPENQSGPVSR